VLRARRGRSGRSSPDGSSVRLPGPWGHRDISANGIRLHVAECGRPGAPLVVLLHGFPEFWWTWRHQLPVLADAGFRAVAVDLRGYGDSDKPPRGYDLWTLAGDVAGLVRALGEPVAHVVGHGWGGVVGWTVTALHPRLVGTLAVMSAPHPLAVRRAVVRDPRGQGRALLQRPGGVLAAQVPRRPEYRLRTDDGAYVERVLRERAAERWPGTDDFAASAEGMRRAMQVPGVAHSSMEYYRWAVRSQARAEGRRFAEAVRRTPTVPVLQVHGADDPYLLERTAAASRRWAGPHLRYEVLAGVGHFPHQERPAEVSALLREFLVTSARGPASPPPGRARG
jgi:pimeloyl-ACP methyl ester carboxylesterase